MMAEPESTCTPSPRFVPRCPRCGEPPTLQTPMPTLGGVAEWFYSCPSDHAWLTKWATA